MTESTERPVRQPSPATLITMLQQRLDEKASHIRRLEDSEITLSALVTDLLAENEALSSRVQELTEPTEQTEQN